MVIRTFPLRIFYAETLGERSFQVAESLQCAFTQSLKLHQQYRTGKESERCIYQFCIVPIN